MWKLLLVLWLGTIAAFPYLWKRLRSRTEAEELADRESEASYWREARGRTVGGRRRGAGSGTKD